MSAGTLPPWRRSDNFGLNAHNRLVERANRDTDLVSTGDCEVMQTPAGRGIILRRPPPVGTDLQIFEVRQAHTTGGVYVGRALNVNESLPFDPGLPGLPGDVNNEPTFLGTWGELCYVINLAEVNAGATSHDLTAGGQNVRYFFGRWMPKPAVDGMRVGVITGYDFAECTQQPSQSEAFSV